MACSVKSRAGATLLELLVVVAVVVILVGVLLPAIQRVREAAARTRSMNNVRQIVLGVHQYAADHGDRFPSVDGNPKPMSGYVGMGPTPHVAAARVLHPNNWQAWFSPISIFVSPADPSLDRVPPGKAVTSYASNAALFWWDPPVGAGQPDGLSSTTAFAERYATCHASGLAVDHASWGPYSRPTFADRGSWIGGPGGGGWEPGYVWPVTGGSPPATQPSTPGVTFQVRPALISSPPPNGSTPPMQPGQCDTRQPQTPHPGGMILGMADGATRTVRLGVAPEVFWAAATPAGGEVLADW